VPFFVPFKEGDQVTFVLDESNTLIDVHPNGQEAEHQYVTGKLIHLDKMQKEIKLTTPDGERKFPLATLEAKQGNHGRHSGHRRGQ
jgi:hypothetical protein